MSRLSKTMALMILSAVLCFILGWAANNITRPVTVAHAQGSTTTTSVWNELPAVNGTGNWVLKNYPNPANAVECFYSGIHQTPGKDYVLRGSQLYSTFWSRTDLTAGVADLTCNYTY
jgi:hypothetical protein